jgi:transposase-like protein
MNHSTTRRERRYSHAFRHKVVSQIEQGKLTIGEAQRLYDIGGATTIQTWMRKLGKAHLLNTVVRVEMADERNKLKELERQKRALESALAQAHVENIHLRSLVTAYEEHAAEATKKKSNAERLITRARPAST